MSRNTALTFKAPLTTAAENSLKYFTLFSEKIRRNISCEPSARSQVSAVYSDATYQVPRQLVQRFWRRRFFKCYIYTFFPLMSGGCIRNLNEIGKVFSEEKSFENVE